MTPPWAIVAGDLAATGGMDRANLALAAGLARRGPVAVACHRIDVETGQHPNVRVVLVPRPFGKHLLGGPPLRRAGAKLADETLAAGGRVVANGGNCDAGDVNWVHCVHAAFPAYPAGGLLRRAKTVAAHALARRAERAAIRNARVVVCNSRKTAAEVVTLIGVPPEKTRVVYLGTDPARFPLIPPAERATARKSLGLADRPHAAFVGQLGNRVKGFDTLFSAWTRLCESPGWDANLLVVGAGAELNQWKERAARVGDRISFLGFRPDVPAVLAAADVLVHPTRYDAYGLGVHEALCRGLPAVVSAAAGIAERYPADLRDLVLPDAEDAAGLADRLRLWRANLDSYAARVRPFADELRSYSWDDMADAFRAAVDSR